MNFAALSFFSLTERCIKNTYYFDVAPRYFQSFTDQRFVDGVISRTTCRFGRLDNTTTSFVGEYFASDQILNDTEYPWN